MKINIHQIFFFNVLACANNLWAQAVESWWENFKKETSWCIVQVYSLFNRNFCSTAEGRVSCDTEWESRTEGGDMEAEGKGFPNQCWPSPVHYWTSPCVLFSTLALPNPALGAQEWHRALYLGLSWQHQVAQTSTPQGLFVASQGAQPQQPDVHIFQSYHHHLCDCLLWTVPSCPGQKSTKHPCRLFWDFGKFSTRSPAEFIIHAGRTPSVRSMFSL